jgi:hypothetical protein
VHAFFALKKRFHFSCKSPLAKATLGCTAGSSRLFDPQYYNDRISERDVQDVVDSLYPSNTVSWLHQNCCAGYQRVAEPQVRRPRPARAAQIITAGACTCPRTL